MHAYLTADAIHSALTLRDLSNPESGPHAMQVLLTDVLTALAGKWSCSVNVVRTPPLVAVRDNYDRLGYDRRDVTRESRYTRYASPTTMLRSHTSADITATLDTYRDRHGVGGVDELIAIPGLVYRRDVVDRTHVGEPHQVDLWRLRSMPRATEEDLEEMVEILVDAVLPDAQWRTTPAEHPYTRALLDAVPQAEPPALAMRQESRG